MASQPPQPDDDPMVAFIEEADPDGSRWLAALLILLDAARDIPDTAA